jgi:quinol monooxygenase YgiN
MVTVGYLTRYEVKPGQEADVERALKAALTTIQEEPATITWFAVRLGLSTFGVFDVFPDEEGRLAHYNADIAQLQEQASEQFVEGSLVMEKVDVLAAKLPQGKNTVTVGLLIRLEAKPGQEANVERFLKAGLARIQQEPEPIAWFAIRLSPSIFGIFDAYTDEQGRQTRLSVGGARLTEQVAELFAQPPLIEQVDILAAKLSDCQLHEAA